MSPYLNVATPEPLVVVKKSTQKTWTANAEAKNNARSRMDFSWWS